MESLTVNSSPDENEKDLRKIKIISKIESKTESKTGKGKVRADGH